MLLIFKFSSIFSSAGFSGEREPTVHLQMCVCVCVSNKGSARGSDGKACLPAMQETQVQPLGGDDPLEEDMATHSSILAWRIPWTEEPGRL